MLEELGLDGEAEVRRRTIASIPSHALFSHGMLHFKPLFCYSLVNSLCFIAQMEHLDRELAQTVSVSQQKAHEKEVDVCTSLHDASNDAPACRSFFNHIRHDISFSILDHLGISSALTRLFSK